jgi:hypothetical protein
MTLDAQAGKTGMSLFKKNLTGSLASLGCAAIASARLHGHKRYGNTLTSRLWPADACAYCCAQMAHEN